MNPNRSATKYTWAVYWIKAAQIYVSCALLKDKMLSASRPLTRGAGGSAPDPIISSRSSYDTLTLMRNIMPMSRTVYKMVMRKDGKQAVDQRTRDGEKIDKWT